MISDRSYVAFADAGVIRVYATAFFAAFPEADDVLRLETCTRLFLRGLKAPMVLKAYELWRGSALENIEKDPYGCVFDMKGTLDDADALAKSMPLRSRVAQHVTWLLRAAKADGHTALPLAALLTKVASKTAVRPDDVKRVIDAFEDLEHLDGLVASTETVMTDAFIASDIKTRVASTTRAPIPFPEDALASLSPEQAAAALTIAESGMCVVTGGPGTGKTTLVRAVVTAFGEHRCMLMAPTGRAARNMGGATVHSASGGQLRRRPIQETSKCDVPADLELMVVDESSMLSTELMVGVLNLAPPRCRLVLVGDDDQLPPVGPGSVFGDCIRSGLVPVARLTYNHRSVTGVQRLAAGILQGQVPRGSEDAVRLVPATTDAEAMRIVTSSYSQAATQAATQAQVLVPQNSYRQILNRALQSVLRPVPVRLTEPTGWGLTAHDTGTMATDGDGSTTLTFPTKTMTLAVDQALTITRPVDPMLPGDLVMALKNQNKKRVRPGEVSACNGDIGTLMRAKPKAVVSFDGGVTEFPDADQWLSLAYVATVHKFQGSECEEVLLPVHQSSGWDRQLLYTAVTRAKTRVTLVGSWSVLDAISKKGRPARWTALSKLLSS